jgi:hypothetical protein
LYPAVALPPIDSLTTAPSAASVAALAAAGIAGVPQGARRMHPRCDDLDGAQALRPRG